MGISSASPESQATSFNALRQQLMDRLKQDARVIQIEPDPTNVSVINLTKDSGWKLRVDVTNLAGRLKTVAPDDIAESVAVFAAAVLGETSYDSTMVFPTIRPRDILNSIENLPSDDSNPRQMSVACEEFSEDSILLYQVKNGPRLSSISWDPGKSNDIGELRTLARRNIDTLVELLHVGEITSGIIRYSLSGCEFLSSGLLMSDAFWAAEDVHFPNGAYIAIPSRESIILVDRRYAGALEAARSIIRIEQQDNVDLVSGLVYERVGTQIRAVAGDC